VSTTRTAAGDRDRIFDQATYWLTLAGIDFLVGVLFLYSGKGKLFDDDGHAPAALQEQFEGTFIDKVPGVDAAWVIIGIMELAVFLLMVASSYAGSSCRTGRGRSCSSHSRSRC
jgi:hypothetical protein